MSAMTVAKTVAYFSTVFSCQPAGNLGGTPARRRWVDDYTAVFSGNTAGSSAGFNVDIHIIQIWRRQRYRSEDGLHRLAVLNAALVDGGNSPGVSGARSDICIKNSQVLYYSLRPDASEKSLKPIAIGGHTADAVAFSLKVPL